MCGGGGGGGPSKSDIKQQKKQQQRAVKRQNKQFRKAQNNAKAQHEQNLAFNVAQFEQGRQDSWEQFNISVMNQERAAQQQMAMQEAQFAAAQAAQEAALQQQLQQNEEMAKRSEEAANKAMGMRLVGQDPEALKVKSKLKKSKLRAKARQGTSQLANPLTISLGGSK